MLSQPLFRNNSSNFLPGNSGDAKPSFFAEDHQGGSRMLYYVSGAPLKNDLSFINGSKDDNNPSNKSIKIHSESNTFTPIDIPTESRDIHLQCNQLCLSSENHQTFDANNVSESTSKFTVDKTISPLSNHQYYNHEKTLIPNVCNHNVKNTDNAIIYQRNFQKTSPVFVNVDENLGELEYFCENEESISNTRNPDSKLSWNYVNF